MERSYIFLDLDDCLFSKAGGSMSVRDLNWLQQYIMAANCGMAPPIKICTGRNIPFVSAVMYMLGRPHGSGFAITENGAVFYSPDTREAIINPQIGRLALRQLKQVKEKIAPELARKYPDLWVFPGNLVNTVFVRKPSCKISLAKLKKIVRRETLLHLNFIRENELKKRLGRPQKLSQKLLGFIKKRIKKIRTHVSIVAMGDSIAVVPRGVNKGTAVAFLGNKECINLRHSVGIGDSKSDIRFLRKLGLIGCPANADDVCTRFVKNNRGKISLSPHLSGVVDVIGWFTQHFDITNRTQWLIEYYI